MIEQAAHEAAIAERDERIRILEAQVAQLTEDERKTDPSNLRPSTPPEQQAPWDMSPTDLQYELVIASRRQASEISQILRRLEDGSEHMASIDRNVAKVSANIDLTNQRIYQQSGELVELRRVCHGNHPPEIAVLPKALEG